MVKIWLPNCYSLFLCKKDQKPTRIRELLHPTSYIIDSDIFYISDNTDLIEKLKTWF